ncbi:MAG: hypothetical protein ACI9W2_003666 [Gammaproteobacteria bacterium]|jgi:hypothetical protein
MLETEHAGQRLTPELLRKANTKGCWEYDAIETLLKGRELPLPEGHEGFTDKYDIRRFDVRVAWWDSNATTYREAFVGPEEARKSIPADLTNGHHLVSYEPKERPLFLGHYWLSGLPRPPTPNIACNCPENSGDSLVRIKPPWPIQLFAHSTQFLVLPVAHYQWAPLGGGC